MIRFGRFTFFPDTSELTQNGVPVHLPPNASVILGALLSKPGRVVAREELCKIAWGERIVEFDQALNTCIRQIRAALQDDARAPRYIETVPRRGYRMCHPISTRDSPVVEHEPAPTPRFSRGGRLTLRKARQFAFGTIALLVAFMMGRNPTSSLPAKAPAVAVAQFQLLDAPQGLAGIEAKLEAAVRGRLVHRTTFERRTTETPDYFLTGTVAFTTAGALLYASLIRVSDGAAVWSGTYNPYCKETITDPIDVIGALVARSVAMEIQGRS